MLVQNSADVDLVSVLFHEDEGWLSSFSLSFGASGLFVHVSP